MYIKNDVAESLFFMDVAPYMCTYFILLLGDHTLIGFRLFSLNRKIRKSAIILFYDEPPKLSGVQGPLNHLILMRTLCASVNTKLSGRQS